MKQSLQLRLGQQLTMTPQLQQAIRLLQLSTLELRTEVQDALDSNMMLELEEDDGRHHDDTAEADVAPLDIPSELPVDSAWEDIYESVAPVHHGPGGDFNGSELEPQSSGHESLRDHLFWQMTLVRFSDVDRLIGAALIDGVDEDGYLRVGIDEVIDALAAEALEVGEDEVEAVLHRLQNFEPAGVAARDLGECLAIQLRQLPEPCPWRELAIDLVSEHLGLLAARDFPSLMETLELDHDRLHEVLDLVHRLSPRPGSQVHSTPPAYVVPDVFVYQDSGVWKVELNPEAAPRLRVNAEYARLIRRADNSSDNNFMRTHLQEARWFIKSLRSRSETLLRVAGCIVDRQRAFLEHGEEAMKPMVLHDIAEAIEMHESTISRVTTNKYMLTPRGIFELKYFFSSHVYTKSGAECSSTAIRALLKKLIAAENPQRPLSDSKLATILADQGIKVARRTVAKYREAMLIPSSSERRELV